MAASLQWALVGRRLSAKPFNWKSGDALPASRADCNCASNAQFCEYNVSDSERIHFCRRYIPLCSQKVAVRTTHGYMNCI